MARLQLNYPNIRAWSCKSKHGGNYGGFIELNWRWKGSAKEGPFGNGTRVVQMQQCCSASTSSSAKEAELDDVVDDAQGADIEGRAGKAIRRGSKFGSLSSFHGWNVRRMVEIDEEMRKVARTQAEAFHEPVVLFNDLFFEFFQAEVLSGLIYTLRNSPPDRYACLVAESVSDDVSESESEVKDIVGVVDVTVMRDNDVLRHLPVADEYLYVSGIAVLSKFRRQKVATALLKACDVLSAIWGFDYLVLRAYEDDSGARNLYTSAGYRVVSGDPAWMTSWIGRRRRVLMIKRCDNT